MTRLIKLERASAAIALLLMAVLPLIEVVSRIAGHVGLAGSTECVQHLTLWVGLLGAALAAAEGRHISLHVGRDLLPPRARAIVEKGVALLATAVTAALAWAGGSFVRSEWASPTRVGGFIPLWLAIIIIPIGFGLVALHLVWRASDRHRGRLVAALGVALAAGIAFGASAHGPALVFPGIAALIGAAVLGCPVFVVLGGAALLLFFAAGTSAAAIPVEAYRIVASPTLPTVPLFTVAGYILAEGGASRRLVRLFRAWFAWIPGGPAVGATLVCAFFTTFTGASGVTILALGGLLLPALVESGFKERFSMGLLTATGSLGLLFPPSLAVILYGTVAHTPIDKLFLAGLLPGLLLVAAVCAMGFLHGRRHGVARVPFDRGEAMAALWAAKWELALPVLVLVSLFGGFTTLVETSALTVIYALVTECLIHRDLRGRDLLRVLAKSATVVGGVVIILSVAMGLTSYLVDAEVPLRAVAWVQANIHSRLVFLLVLNGFLLLVGCLMDIFSAIVVVVPLIAPIAAAFGIDPLHLGVIFLVNLELGYLHPPVGMNLFLAAYRFERRVWEICRATLPFIVVVALVVLTVTYVPALTSGFVALWGAR
jgi:tripartite ATP-independent transporter DctM subunit